jgi:uncharacterized membrane-anchored protein
MRMNKKKSLLFYSFITLQVLVLSFIAFSYYATEWYGEEVKLKTEPIDPRDLLYGDYVILNYDISRVNISEVTLNLAELEDFYGKRPVYVVLNNIDYGKVVSIHDEKPHINSNQIILKARMHYWGKLDREIRLEYGFERYYSDSETALFLEESFGKFDVIIKVSPWGQKISRLAFKEE